LNILDFFKNSYPSEQASGTLRSPGASNDPVFFSTTVLGHRRERSSSDSSPSPRPPPGDRNRLKIGRELGFNQQMNEHEQGLGDEPPLAVNRGRGGRGRGRGTRGRKKCRSRGAKPPPAWSHDPFPGIRGGQDASNDDSDLREEDFQPSSHLAEDDQNSQSQHAVSIPGGPLPEIQVISAPGHHFILSLAVLCRTFLSDHTDGENTITQTLKHLSGTHDRSSTLRSVMSVNSLENLAERCAMSEENVAVSDFMFMVNAIQLRCKVIRLVLLSLLNSP